MSTREKMAKEKMRQATSGKCLLSRGTPCRQPTLFPRPAITIPIESEKEEKKVLIHSLTATLICVAQRLDSAQLVTESRTNRWSVQQTIFSPCPGASYFVNRRLVAPPTARQQPPFDTYTQTNRQFSTTPNANPVLTRPLNTDFHSRASSA